MKTSKDITDIQIIEVVKKSASYRDVCKRLGVTYVGRTYRTIRNRILALKLDELYQSRRDEKEAQARPFRRQIEEVHKTWNDKEFEFNRETERQVGERAVVFEKGFDEFEDKFSDIDELAEEVDGLSYMDGMDSTNVMVAAAPAAGASMNMMRVSNSRKGAVRDISDDLLPTEQDKALSRINTLKYKVADYRQKVSTIKGRIKTLEKEISELTLIRRHLKEEKEYTLDLERLSALGFEE